MQLAIHEVGRSADNSGMTPSRPFKQVERCSYLKVCYLAEALRCFGYKTDCVLYQKSNGDQCDEARFHEAMDTLINKAKAKFENLPV
jgi:hypothetical protein